MDGELGTAFAYMRHMVYLRTAARFFLVAAAAACTAETSGGEAGDESNFTEVRSLFANKAGAKKAHFPIMLEHGFAASAEASSIWKFDGVATDLMAAGHVFVSASDVEPFNGVVARAKTMETHVRAVQAQCAKISGCDPRGVHIVAHSFGGLHAREYLRQHPPSKAAADGLPPVISLTTISTPNRGTQVADFGLGLIEAFRKHPVLESLVESDVNKLAGLIGRTFTKSELVQDPHVETALRDLSEANAAAFAASHPAVENVRYFTWAGFSVNPNPILHPIHPNRTTGAFPSECGTNFGIAGRMFASDALLFAPHDISGHFFSGLPNDGMATIASAKALPGATFMGCIPADHLAEVGHSTDEKRQWTGFEHKAFYRFVASGLAALEN